MTDSFPTKPDPQSVQPGEETVTQPENDSVPANNGNFALTVVPVDGTVVDEESGTTARPVPEQNQASLHLYRGNMEGANAFPDDALLDAAVLHYEYDRRRRSWWETRRWFVYGLAVLTVLLLLAGLIGLIVHNNLAGLLLVFSAILFVLFLLVSAYSWWTLPRVLSFGRVYRRFVGIPLERGGLVWSDPVTPPPDFPALRDNFFALYRDSDELGSKIQPNDDEETHRKKRTLNELNHLIAPLKSAASSSAGTPYVPADTTAALDNLWLQPLGPQEMGEVVNHTLPLMPQSGQALRLNQLTHEVEDYSSLDELRTSLQPEHESEHTPSIHSQISGKVEQNLSMVAQELGRWQERAEREKAFNAGLRAHYQESVTAVQEGYEGVETALEAEVRPAIQRLEAETAFYRSQVQRYYTGQKDALVASRDTALHKLDAQREELLTSQDERLDEQRLLQAELKGLNEQRNRLDNSTNSRFEGLKSQLGELTERTYSLPPTPHFRSDYNIPPLAGDSEEVLRLLAQLRADARIATSAVNNALNRYARLRFEPLDELGRLRQQIAAGTKWQATAWLGNLINFRQSGQLLALAGEVGDAVGVYLDNISEFERLNNQWCGAESAIRELGLSAYQNQLGEAQRYLEGLEQALNSLQSSLAMAPHSPEMARPSTFQNLYDLAAGLQRELDELGGLAGSIARTQERLSELDAELAQLSTLISDNERETEEVRRDSEEKLADLEQKQSQLLSRLDEMKVARLQKIRAHIEALSHARDNELANLQVSSGALQELSDISEKILQKHLRQSQKLLDEANTLRQRLEQNISTIVHEFERSARSDRSLLASSEVFVPAWYFQLSERPLWRKKIIGFACCYSAIRRDYTARDTFLNFFLTGKPGTFYQLDESPELEALVQADNMEYPAGEIEIPANTPDWLVTNNWVSTWLVKLNRLKK